MIDDVLSPQDQFRTAPKVFLVLLRTDENCTKFEGHTEQHIYLYVDLRHFFLTLIVKCVKGGAQEAYRTLVFNERNKEELKESEADGQKAEGALVLHLLL